MNGRLFDPLLGLFMQATAGIANPLSLQAYNRYAYCENNPLTCHDPTGLQAVLPVRSATATIAMAREGEMTQVGIYISTASANIAFSGTPRPVALHKINQSTSGYSTPIDSETWLKENGALLAAHGLNAQNIIAQMNASRSIATGNINDLAVIEAMSSQTFISMQLNDWIAYRILNPTPIEKLRNEIAVAATKLADTPMSPKGIAPDDAILRGQQAQLEVERNMLIGLLKTIQDLCSECSEQSLSSLKLVASPLEPGDYDSRFSPDTLATFSQRDGGQAIFFQTFFRMPGFVQVASVLHEYLHSLPSNIAIFNAATPEQMLLDHASRPWEAPVIAIEKEFRERNMPFLWKLTDTLYYQPPIYRKIVDPESRRGPR